uniref:Uncharacterized protein n=1 Tax=Romanomermis culicivorax TaxID=13658 RepID=A0A915I2S9_ROMCU
MFKFQNFFNLEISNFYKLGFFLEALNTDEDEIDDEGQEYLQRLAKSEKDSGNDEDFSDGGDSSDFAEETDLESYETVLDGEEAQMDEYIFFKDTLE